MLVIIEYGDHGSICSTQSVGDRGDELFNIQRMSHSRSIAGQRIQVNNMPYGKVILAAQRYSYK